MGSHADRRVRAVPRSAVVIGAVLVFWVMLSLLTQAWLIPLKSPPNSYDLYPSWYGSRAVLLDGDNPYTEDMARRITLAMGFPIDEAEGYAHRVFYPATIVWILLPLWVRPFKLAIVGWCGLQLLMLFVLPMLVFLLLEWRIRPLPLALVVLLSIMGWRHSFNAYLLGQFTIFTLGCLILAWAALMADRPWLVALALTGSTLRGEGILLTAACLLTLLLTRRLRALGWWSVFMGVAGVLSLIASGFWFPDFLTGIREYQRTQDTTLPASILGGGAVMWAVAGAHAVWCGWLLVQVRALPDRQRIGWGLSVLCLASLLLLRQSKDYTLVYALLPIWFALWAGRDRRWTFPLVVLILISPWLYAGARADFGHGSRLEQFVTPLGLLALLTYQWLSRPATAPGSAQNTR